MYRENRQRAFNLIESLVVMFIIVLLASIVIPALFGGSDEDEEPEIELILPISQGGGGEINPVTLEIETDPLTVLPPSLPR